MIVYVCHPFADDPAANIERVRAICRAIVRVGVVPLAPQLYLQAFMDEATERDLVLELCVALVGCCDELWWYGTRITAGMEREISAARAMHIEVRQVVERDLFARYTVPDPRAPT